MQTQTGGTTQPRAPDLTRPLVSAKTEHKAIFKKPSPQKKSLRIGYKLPFLREAFKESQKQTQDRTAIIHQAGCNRAARITVGLQIGL